MSRDPDATTDRDRRAEAPCGAWASPITAALIAEAGIGLGALSAAGGDLFWTELRPREGGRTVIVRRDRGGAIADVTPEGYNVRTLVHEYGGGAYAVAGGGEGGGPVVFFSNFDDQRLYRQDLGPGGVAGGGSDAPEATGAVAAGRPRPITPAPASSRALRYADARPTPDGARVICVRERHEDGEVVNELVAVPAGGGAEPVVLASGHDFYAAPRVSPDGARLAWICWDDPNMPWDGTELWVADLTAAGVLAAERRAAGGPHESVLQPAWSPGGRLHFVSDRSGWWNLYRAADEALAAKRSSGEALPATPLAPLAAEFAKPSWTFGLQNYAFLADDHVLAFWSENGVDRLGVITADGPGEAGAPRPIPCAFTAFGAVAVLAGWVAVLGGSPTQSAAIALLDAGGGDLHVVRRSSSAEIDAGFVSTPEPIEFPVSYEAGSVTGPLLDELRAAGGPLAARALYYPPANRDFTPPPGERPPLLVTSHGGPTSAAEAVLSLGIQFWTSRGIAVVDVNYGGSTGHGRAYRERLRGNWGIVDTVDCIAAARFLAARGDVDPARLAIRGGSAGGYTTLNALARHRVFAAGASLAGLADLEMFATGGTHKFEAHYLLGLVGPYPEAAEVYRQRSPIHHADDISCPVIVLQGLEDEIVPPAQAELIVAALRRNGLPHAYVTFEGEQHGLRKAGSIVRGLEAELYFYGRVFGFAPADEIAVVPIENLA
jgi:dipeptidyl aminopeptidase/acylaminoacyl peptidase